jgi:hypothetical protein
MSKKATYVAPPGGTGVVRIDGWDLDPDLYGTGRPNRATVTWQTWLDGELLGNAVTEEEGHRWIEDMRKTSAP